VHLACFGELYRYAIAFTDACDHDAHGDRDADPHTDAYAHAAPWWPLARTGVRAVVE